MKTAQPHFHVATLRQPRAKLIPSPSARSLPYPKHQIPRGIPHRYCLTLIIMHLQFIKVQAAMPNPPYRMNADKNCRLSKYITRHSSTKAISHGRIRHPKSRNMIIWHSDIIPVNYFNISASNLDFFLFLYYHESVGVTSVLCQFSLLP